MRVRRFLIIAPLCVIVVLLGSYFWVPTYEQQGEINPQRIKEYVDASIGDAAILNPILSADSASSQIESQVFEGLLDYDENLRFRGRIARKWEITEQAYFYLNPNAPIAGLKEPDGPTLSTWLKQKIASLPADDNDLIAIESIKALPPRTFTRNLPPPKATKEEKPQAITIEAPERIRLTLNKVDSQLFDKLETILGKRYFQSFPSEKYVKWPDSIDAETRKKTAGKLLPATEHNPVILFHLRDDVFFHDGHRLDAEDVKFTYQSIVNPKNLSPRVPDYEPVKTVEIIDPVTVKVVYKRLYSPALGTWGMSILPEHRLNSKALAAEAKRRDKDPATFTMRQSEFNRNPVGSGPFVFEDWKSDQYIRLKRFERYWDGPPNYQRYVLRIIPDLLTQEMEFYAGTIDSYPVQPHQVKRLRSDARFQSFSRTAMGYSYVAYNLRRKPFDDVRVRRALGMAIDTEKIIRYVLYGQGEPMTGPFPKQTDYYDHGIKPLPYDPEGAVRLLHEAGWRRGADGYLQKEGRRMAFTLLTNHGNDLRKAIMAIAQDAWKKIGIEVRTDPVEWSVFIEKRINKLDFDAVVLGWSMPLEPDLFQIWHSSQTGPFQLNFAGYKDPAADRLIVKIREEYDHARQVEYCHRLHKLIADAQPYTFLYVGKSTSVLDRRLVIRKTQPDGTESIEPIRQTKSGSIMFHFNRWVRVPFAPNFTDQG